LIRVTTSLFLLLSIILIVGVVFADHFVTTPYILEYVSIGFFLSLFVAVFLKGKYSGFILLLAFFFFGSILVIFKRSDRNLPDDMQVLRGYGEIMEVKASESGWNQVFITTHAYENGGKLIPCSESIIVTTKESQNYGDQLVFQLELDRIKSKGNPGEFDVEAYYNRRNVRYHGFMGENDFRLVDHRPYSFHQFLLSIREWSKSLVLEYLPGDAQGLALAIILGDKGYLADETVNNFQDAGAMHVLAVSGLHVGIVMLLLNFLLQRMSRFVSKKAAIYLTLILTFFYAGLTGFSPSVVRSFIMFGVLLFAQLNSWNSYSLNALGFAAFVLVFADSLVVYDLGFQLSFLAMLGILVFYRKVSGVVYIRNKYLRKIWQGTAVGIAAQITTVPLVLYHFGQFANYFWLSNLLVMLFAGIILGIGLSFLFLGKVHLLAGWLGAALGILVAVFQYLIGWIARIPFSVAKGFDLSSGALIFLYLLLLIVLITGRLKYSRKVALVSVLVGLIFVQFERYSKLSTEELIVFNSNSPLVTYRNQGELFVFYSEPEMLGKIETMVNNYRRRLGSQTKYMLLRIGDQIMLPGKKFIGIDYKNRWLISSRKRKYMLIRNYKDLEDPAGIPIKMAYLPVTEEHELSLDNGAIYLQP